MHYTPSVPLFTRAYGQGSINTMPLNIAAITIAQVDLICKSLYFKQEYAPLWSSKKGLDRSATQAEAVCGWFTLRPNIGLCEPNGSIQLVYK